MSDSRNRITIQCDLNGYSFKIHDRNGALVQAGDGTLDEAAADPLLLRNYSAASVFIAPSGYTLVPSIFFSPEEKRSLLAEMSVLSEEDEVLSLEIPLQKAVLLFSLSGRISGFFGGRFRNLRFFPLIYALIDRIPSIQDHNRLIVSFSEQMVHIVAAEREKLLIANSFPAKDRFTSIYYILSVARQVLFNAEHTQVYIYGTLPDQAGKELSRYFAGVSEL